MSLKPNSAPDEGQDSQVEVVEPESEVLGLRPEMTRVDIEELISKGAEIIWKGGKILARIGRVLSVVGNALTAYEIITWLDEFRVPVNARPPVIYDPESKRNFHRQADGSYRPDPVRRD